jgi:hypothetical protein
VWAQEVSCGGRPWRQLSVQQPANEGVVRRLDYHTEGAPIPVAHTARAAALQTSIVSAVVLGPGIGASLLGPGTVLGDSTQPIVNEKFSDLAPAIAELRQEAGQDRREIVKRNRLLTAPESAVFWPLYDQYRAERNKLGDRTVRMITDFAAKRDAMSEDDAEGEDRA